MNWISPDVEIHITGWPAVIVLAFFAVLAINLVLTLANMAVKALS